MGIQTLGDTTSMTMWMVRAGQEGELFDKFIENSVVAIGWAEIHDLGALESFDAILATVQQRYPGEERRWHGSSAGTLYRFSRQMDRGHHVITYDRTQRLYAVGTVVDGYQYNPGFDPDFPHTRHVEWFEAKISRDILSVPTKNTLGATQAVFKLSEDAERETFDAAQDGRGPQPADPIPPENLLEGAQARSVEFTKDAVVSLGWEDLQKLIAGLLRAMGYQTRISSKGSDRGKDIVASRDGLGLEDPRVVVEVKHRPNTRISAPDIRSFVGGRHPEDRGLYVSTGGFSREARYEADRANIRVTTMDLNELVETIFEHYDNMDIETRLLLPLRRVYWPVEDTGRDDPVT